MQQDKTIIFRTFESPLEANIVRARLEANGVPCFLSDENIMNLNPLYNRAIGGVKLHVFEKDMETASRVLAVKEDLSSEENESSGTVCPSCGSANVSYGQRTERKVGPFALLFSLLFLIYPIWTQKAWHCYDCRNEFDKKNKD